MPCILLTLPIIITLLTLSSALPSSSAAPASEFSRDLTRVYSDFSARPPLTNQPRGNNPSSNYHSHTPVNHHSRPRWLPPPQDLLMPVTGNIRMKSSHRHEIPFTFSLSPHVCAPLATECHCLVKDLEKHFLSSYPTGVQFSHRPGVPTVIGETVSMEMGGRDFRASLEIKLLGKAGDRIGKSEFQILVGLLGRVVMEIESESRRRGKSGLGSVLVKGIIEGFAVEALWTFYEFDKGLVVRCN